MTKLLNNVVCSKDALGIAHAKGYITLMGRNTAKSKLHIREAGLLSQNWHRLRSLRKMKDIDQK